MSLELLNTFGTLLTVAIIAATAIAAMVQLRHLRAGNQINAMISVDKQLDGRAFRKALYLVARGLEDALQDPAFREHVAAVARGLAPPEVSDDYIELRNAAQLVGNTYEELGILVKGGIVDKMLFLDLDQWGIIRAWDGLQNFTAFFRDAAGAAYLWENFELLTVLAKDWLKQHPAGTYPKGMGRLELHNPWPVPPMPATT